MRVCFVGKYPPIQGGVSAQSYWAVRGLAERGHEVAVVTNAAEAEQGFRVRLEARDAAHLEPSFPGTGGSVRLFPPEKSGRRMSHIPAGNPFVSKLAGMAVSVIRALDCEVVVGSYLEPFGMAAHLAASWTGRPLLLQHAGSDLDRLMRIPELAIAYREVLRSAAGVVTRPNLVGRFLGLGVPLEAILMGPPFGLSTAFSPEAATLTPAEIDRLALVAPGHGFDPGPGFDPGLPTLGMYGKPGEFKGTYDFLAAAAKLRAEGAAFNLLLMSGESQSDRLKETLAGHSLHDRTWMLPFLPNWRVPAFLRACTAVAFLERDFPVVIHGPVVPREVLASGTCLVLSGEIHGKQVDRDRLVDGDSILLVPDPKEREVLTAQLRRVVADPGAAREIGARGRLATEESRDFGGFVDAWEALLERAVSGKPAASGPAATGPSACDRPMTAVERVGAQIRWLPKLLGPDLAAALAGFDGLDLPDLELPAAVSRYLADSADPVVRDAARYHLARIWALIDDLEDMPPTPNALGGHAPTAEAMAKLFPFRSATMRIEEFDHDVTPLFTVSQDAIVRRPTRICFGRLPNLSRSEVRLNGATAMLLGLCDGRLAAAEVVAACGGAGESARTVAREAYTTLGRLYGKGLIAFAAAPASARALISAR